MEKDISFFTKCLELLPTEYTSADTNRMTIVYFCISALDIMNALPDEHHRKLYTEWIYSNYIAKCGSHLIAVLRLVKTGFRGSSFAGNAYTCASPIHEYDTSHLAMTYTALITLIILDDDLSRIDRRALIDSVKCLQLESGCFCAFQGCDEGDMRFLFCACAISYILEDWSAIDMNKSIAYIKSSIAFDGGIGQGPNLESHGGSTYCAIAALKLMGKLSLLTLSEKQACILWCVNRQKSGFEGRPFKPVDSCYSFWIGATLKILEAYHLVDVDLLQGSLNCSHTKYGGFSKNEHGTYPDILHSYLGLAGSSISGRPGLAELDCPLNISKRALSAHAALH